MTVVVVGLFSRYSRLPPDSIFFKHTGVGGVPTILGMNFGSDFAGGSEALEKHGRKIRWKDLPKNPHEKVVGYFLTFVRPKKLKPNPLWRASGSIDGQSALKIDVKSTDIWLEIDSLAGLSVGVWVKLGEGGMQLKNNREPQLPFAGSPPSPLQLVQQDPSVKPQPFHPHPPLSHIPPTPLALFVRTIVKPL